MAMTNSTMAPAVAANPRLTTDQINDAAKVAAKAIDINLLAGNDDPLAEVKSEFDDKVKAESMAAKKMLAQQAQEQAKVSEKGIRDLVEDDAYNLEVAISAKASYSPNFLKIELKDKNYIARWCNLNPIRQATLVAQGFRIVKETEVANLDELEMFLDSQKHFVYSDLIAMQIPKNMYYAGLRRAYLKSLHATNNKKAAEAGAQFASNQLKAELTGAQRSYLASHDLTEKPVYNPNLGV